MLRRTWIAAFIGPDRAYDVAEDVYSGGLRFWKRQRIQPGPPAARHWSDVQTLFSARQLWAR